MDEEQAYRNLATAKARFILAEAGTDPTEFVRAQAAREAAEEAYAEAVNS